MTCHPAFFTRRCIAAGLMIASLFAWRADAQGVIEPITVLRTGAGGPLISGTQSFFLPASNSAQEIELAIGFATDETIAPGVFYDSLTLTIADAGGLLSAVFLTADVTGTLWAPAGGLPIDPDSIGRELVDFPDLTGEVPSNQVAYWLKLPVPAEMSGRSLTLYLDLFDNDNPAGSLGWMGQVIVVPEPTPAVFAAVSALLLLARFRRA